MKTLTLRTRIGTDGTMDLHVPSNLLPGDAEVVVVVEAVGTGRPQHGPALARACDSKGQRHGIRSGCLPPGRHRRCAPNRRVGFVPFAVVRLRAEVQETSE